MKKCTKCGKEFEGNCCPNCGTWATGEKKCPKCGNKLKVGSNFCEWCGYSFGGNNSHEPQKQKSSVKEKSANIWAWIKSHLKIVIPVAVTVLLVIILACSIPACIKAKDNGTYYKLKGEELDKKTYFIISSGKWKDEDGESGTYKKDGDKIIFYIEFFGSTEEAASGTIKDGILTINEGGYNQVYISESHKHKGGEWLYSETGHYKICTVCNLKYNKGNHDNDDRCEACGYSAVEYLNLKLNYNKDGYTVSGMKSTEKKLAINIPKTYNKLPVTSIGGSAFSHCSSLTSITIPNRESISDLHPTNSY